MKNLLRIAALTLLALSVSVMPLRGIARMDNMDCCLHTGSAQNHSSTKLYEADQYEESRNNKFQNNKTDCPHQDNCQSDNCLTSSSCSTSGPGITTTSLLSFKSVMLNLYGHVDHLYSSQSTPPLLKPPL